MSEAKKPELEKEVVQLPDGRRLIYYRFPEAPQGAAPVPVPPPASKER